MFLTTSQNSF